MDANELQGRLTRALCEIETIEDGTLVVTVESAGHRRERETGDGDHCEGQNWISGEAWTALTALKEAGYEQVEFGGRKDMGHSGGGCLFAVRKV